MENHECIPGYTKAVLPAGGGLSAQYNLVSTQFNLKPTWFPPPPPVFLNTETWFFFLKIHHYISALSSCNTVCEMYMHGNCGVSGYLFVFPPEGQDTVIKNGSVVFPHVFKTRGGKMYTSYTRLLHKPFPKGDLLAPVMERGRFVRGRITWIWRFSRGRTRQAGLAVPSPAPQQQPQHRLLQI